MGMTTDFVREMQGMGVLAMIDCSDCPDLKTEYSANLIWYCKHDPRHASANVMLKPGGRKCIRE